MTLDFGRVSSHLKPVTGRFGDNGVSNMTSNTGSQVPDPQTPRCKPADGSVAMPAPPDATGRAPAYFEREHRRLDRQFHEHLLAIAGGSFILARQHVQRWRLALTRHIAIEDTP